MSRLWPFIPESITANLVFKTNVLEAITTEQRIKRRASYPRLELVYEGLLFNDDIFIAKAIAETANSELLVPDFRYGQSVIGPYSSGNLVIVLDTDYWYPIATESIIAWFDQENYHQSTIASVGSGQITASTGPTSELRNFNISPLNTMKIPDGVSINMESALHAKYTFTAILDLYKDLSGSVKSYPTFQTYTTYTDRDILTSSVSQRITKLVSKIDSISGQLALEEKFDHVDKFGSISFKDEGLQAMFQREAFFHSVAGRLSPFWKPTWTRDMVLEANASSAATTIIVTASNSALTTDYIGRRINITKNGDVHEQYEITGCSISSNQATLTIAPGLATDLNIVDVVTISELNLMRLRSDNVSISYSSGIIGSGSVGLQGLDNDL